MESHSIWDHSNRRPLDVGGSTAPNVTIPLAEEAIAVGEDEEAALLAAALGMEREKVLESFPQVALRNLADVLRHRKVLQSENERLCEDVRREVRVTAGLEADMRNLETAFAAEKQRSGDLQMNLEVITQAKRQESTQALREVTDLKRQCAQLRGLESTFQTTLRRLETENAKIKDALAKLRRGTGADSKRGMTLKGALPVDGSAAGAAAAFEEKICGPFRRQNATLNREVAHLKEILVDVQQHLTASPYDHCEGNRLGSNEMSGWANPVYQSVDWFCGDFKATVLDSITKLHERGAVSAPSDAPACKNENIVAATESSPQRSSVEQELRQQLASAEHMLTEQERVIHSCLFGQGGVPFSPPPKRTLKGTGTKSAKGQTPSLTLSARAEQEDELQRRWEALERREQRLAKAEAEKLAADERADQARLLSAIKGSNIPLAVRSENIVGPVSATPASSKYLRNLGIITAAPKQLQDAMDAEGDCEIAHGNTGTGR
jgi:hypothetical protein